MTADTEATVLRLFGPKAFENLQLVFMDFESLLDKVDAHNVEYSAVAAYEIRTDANVSAHFTGRVKLPNGTHGLGAEYKTQSADQGYYLERSFALPEPVPTAMVQRQWHAPNPVTDPKLQVFAREFLASLRKKSEGLTFFEEILPIKL